MSAYFGIYLGSVRFFLRLFTKGHGVKNGYVHFYNKKMNRGKYCELVPVRPEHCISNLDIEGPAYMDEQDGRQRAEDRPPVGSVSFLPSTHRYFSCDFSFFVCWNQCTSRGDSRAFEFDTSYRFDSLSASTLISPNHYLWLCHTLTPYCVY